MKLTTSSLQKAIGVAALAFLFIPAASADAWDKKTNVTFRQAVEFPGGTVLAPGNYVLKLLNSSTNRNIVTVYNENQDHMYAMVMAVPARRMEPAEKTILTFYETPQDSPAFIHTWFYPGDTAGQEFPYPKNRVRFVNAVAPTAAPLMAAAAPLQPAPLAVNAAPVEPTASRATLTQPSEAPIARNDVIQTPAEEPVLLAQATPPAPVVSQTPQAGEVVGDATAPPDQLPATASNAPFWAVGSMALLAGAFLTRIARRVRV